MSFDTVFTPTDPLFAERVSLSFSHQGLMATLGARLRSVEPGRVSIELPFSSAIAQQQGLFHGGTIGAIADTAGGYAALSLMSVDSEVVTVEYKINFIRPANGALIVAQGQVLRAGRSVTVARVDVNVIENGQTVTIALLQATFMRVVV